MQTLPRSCQTLMATSEKWPWGRIGKIILITKIDIVMREKPDNYFKEFPLQWKWRKSTDCQSTYLVQPTATSKWFTRIEKRRQPRKPWPFNREAKEVGFVFFEVYLNVERFCWNIQDPEGTLEGRCWDIFISCRSIKWGDIVLRSGTVILN